ncbi:alpha/beta hydrolase [Gordoniibacillus kamchatkensis]|uniref:alpha/beta hydrolase n=1 Tax=Gordoniibacillus kamchatkensis TaxID=1590651 RepID=UPI000698F4E2|nr:alpha/beta fold hydrolase [Paenibacillus sp. VKM B-2647]
MFIPIVMLTIIGGAMLYFGTAGVLLLFAPKGKRVTLEQLGAEPITQDLSGLPALSKYRARDGAELEYRYYPARGVPDKPVFILLHGISVDGKYLHTLASRIAQRAMAHVYVPNFRGYGEGPQRRGDIDYVGQLEDDLADLIRFIHMDHPSMPIALGGHSAGGGTALRFAAGKYGALVDACLLLSPALPPSAPIHKKEKPASLPVSVCLV